ncbi:MAG: hypothetical protein GX234_02180 [Clostridiales bacterium]|nr:hypothetical protein [Clostridiales bacterium]
MKVFFKKSEKGSKGYIDAQKRFTVIRTLIYFLLSVSIFVMGYVSTKTRMNLLTVVAVLGCLPASKSMVNAIMFLKSRGCSDSLYQEVEKRAGGLTVCYDLFLTSYQKNFQLSTVLLKGHNIVAMTETEKTDTAEAKKHIEECLKIGGYQGYTVKVFQEREKFLNRIEQMCQTEENEPRDQKEVIHTLLDISL